MEEGSEGPLANLSLENHSNNNSKTNKSIFRHRPPMELVNSILVSMGIENGILNTKPFTTSQLIDTTMEEWLPLLEPYYIPCKARRFLDYITKEKFPTVIRHIIRVHNFDVRTHEKVLCGTKKTTYRIEPITPSLIRNNNQILLEFI